MSDDRTPLEIFFEGGEDAEKDIRRIALVDGLKLLMMGAGKPFMREGAYFDAADALLQKMEMAVNAAKVK